jgi:hypothetical protein
VNVKLTAPTATGPITARGLLDVPLLRPLPQRSLPAMDDDSSLYDDLERRALFDLPDEADDETAPDVLDSLRGGTVEEPAQDISLGGYIEKHDRVPAFEGSDGQPYTVDIDVVEDDDDVEAPFVGFLVFIRWAATGAGIMDHVESGDLARGRTEAEARRAVMDLSLYEIRAELDAAIRRRQEALED